MSTNPEIVADARRALAEKSELAAAAQADASALVARFGSMFLIIDRPPLLTLLELAFMHGATWHQERELTRRVTEGNA